MGLLYKSLKYLFIPLILTILSFLKIGILYTAGGEGNETLELIYHQINTKVCDGYRSTRKFIYFLNMNENVFILIKNLYKLKISQTLILEMITPTLDIIFQFLGSRQIEKLLKMHLHFYLNLFIKVVNEIYLALI